MARHDERPVLTEPTRRLRIAVDELPTRETRRGDRAIDVALRPLGAAEGSACRLDCDCRIGLVCAEGICSEKD